ncbi:hypothetical protein XELAEV_18033289mg [Xenopus laevis]|uniref:Uncharacterized protein n=1 Tax=Xenopus laevis TaxID=8355 RepID=A0A974CJ15_XENLA|nr:hypothetical protein XELAEV_18033289mg [Xenopus laevis]
MPGSGHFKTANAQMPEGGHLNTATTLSVGSGHLNTANDPNCEESDLCSPSAPSVMSGHLSMTNAQNGGSFSPNNPFVNIAPTSLYPVLTPTGQLYSPPSAPIMISGTEQGSDGSNREQQPTSTITTDNWQQEGLRSSPIPHRPTITQLEDQVLRTADCIQRARVQERVVGTGPHPWFPNHSVYTPLPPPLTDFKTPLQGFGPLPPTPL